MNVRLKFFATFREAVGGKTLDREVATGTTVEEVLAALEADYDIDLLEGGDVRPQVTVLHGGRDIVHQGGVDTVLEADDQLSIFPPVAGG